MAPLVPYCQFWYAANSSPQAHMNAMYAFFNDGSPNHSWSLVDEVTSGTDITSFVIEQGTAPDVQQVTIRMDSGLIKGWLDPNGTKTTVGAPATPTDPATGFSGNQSGEITFLRHIDTENVYSTRGLIAEYPDAVLFLIEINAANRWVDGGHFGKIYSGFNSNDEDFGITGHGIVGGFPDLGATGQFDWINNSSSSVAQSHSQFRVGLTASISPVNNIWTVADLSGLDTDTTLGGGLLNGSLRLPPYKLSTNGSTTNVSTNTDVFTRFGITKYLRMADERRSYLTVISDTASNQAWQHMNNTTSTSAALFLWDKTVVP